MKIFYSITFLIFSFSNLNSQKQDHIWLWGYFSHDIIDKSYLLDTTLGSTNMDFYFDPPKIYYDSTRIWDFEITNSSICDINGDMLLYTNGQAVYNGENQIIEDTINYSKHWDNWSTTIYNEDSNTDTLVNYGLPTIQGALILPYPGDLNLFYVFYSMFDVDLLKATKLKFSLIDINKNDGNVELLFRDSLIIDHPLGSGGMNAVQHANGRDWWLIKLGRNNNEIYSFLIDPEGIHDQGVQLIGDPIEHKVGQLYFSPKGNRMAYNSGFNFDPIGSNVNILDFDRCTGKASNRQSDTISKVTLSCGISFSPNGQYVYASNNIYIYQYDTKVDEIIASRTIAATYDGYKYLHPGSTVESEIGLGFMALGPDGRIYVSATANSTRKMGVINRPNAHGIKSEVRQHSIDLPTAYIRSMPNFPNYRLGPLDGSSCDTLGINNLPIANYRYTQDTLDDLHIYFHDLSYFDPVDYHWEFGDGNNSDELEPDHSYESTGVYEVCLTVSNDYDTNTSCKTIILGPDATKDEKVMVDISLYPNPVVDDMNLSFHNYLPIDATLQLYGISGKLTSTYPLHGGMNSLSLEDLLTGVYLYRVIDKGVVIGNGEIVKI